MQNASHECPDFSRTDDPGGSTVKIEPEQTFECKITIAHACIRSMDLPVESQYETDRVFCHCIRGVCRNSYDRHPATPSSDEIHIIESRTPQCDQTCSVAGKIAHDCFI